MTALWLIIVCGLLAIVYGVWAIWSVMQADAGCDFDFLRARPGEAAESEPLGLVGGPIGGW